MRLRSQSSRFLELYILGARSAQSQSMGEVVDDGIAKSSFH